MLFRMLASTVAIMNTNLDFPNLTIPLVFFKVCAANCCVTPTREIPSTSMI